MSGTSAKRSPRRSAGGSDVALRQLLGSPACQGAGSITVVAREPFWAEEDLPFFLYGGGHVLRVVPEAGFTRENLAATVDERQLVVDCPDDEGWLVPSGVVAAWMTRHVSHAGLDDVLLAHPIYAHATKVDAKGRSRMGPGRLVHWTPGVPTVAALVEPPFTPGDKRAPTINRQRAAYADGVVDLLAQLRSRFDLLEVEVAARLVG